MVFAADFYTESIFYREVTARCITRCFWNEHCSTRSSVNSSFALWEKKSKTWIQASSALKKKILNAVGSQSTNVFYIEIIENRRHHSSTFFFLQTCSMNVWLNCDLNNIIFF